MYARACSWVSTAQPAQVGHRAALAVNLVQPTHLRLLGRPQNTHRSTTACDTQVTSPHIDTS
jgi:hypothetical protein